MPVFCFSGGNVVFGVWDAVGAVDAIDFAGVTEFTEVVVTVAFVSTTFQRTIFNGFGGTRGQKETHTHGGGQTRTDRVAHRIAGDGGDEIMINGMR